MTAKYSTIFSILFLAFTFTGCGNQNTPSVVHAAAPTPTPIISTASTCGGQACTGTDTKQWGSCQYETHRYGNTFTISLEIGVNSNATDPGTSNCFVPIAGGTAMISGVHGTVNYLPWTQNVSSMALRINTNGDGCLCGENTLYAAKLTAHPYPVSVGFDATFPSAIAVTNGANGPGTYIVVAFNDDMANAKPTTISVAFSGTTQ